jgi:hypothetical protein
LRVLKNSITKSEIKELIVSYKNDVYNNAIEINEKVNSFVNLVKNPNEKYWKIKNMTLKMGASKFPFGYDSLYNKIIQAVAENEHIMIFNFHMDDVGTAENFVDKTIKVLQKSHTGLQIYFINQNFKIIKKPGKLEELYKINNINVKKGDIKSNFKSYQNDFDAKFNYYYQNYFTNSKMTGIKIDEDDNEMIIIELKNGKWIIGEVDKDLDSELLDEKVMKIHEKYEIEDGELINAEGVYYVNSSIANTFYLWNERNKLDDIKNLLNKIN